jgi:hypothetical protein
MVTTVRESEVTPTLCLMPNGSEWTPSTPGYEYEKSRHFSAWSGTKRDLLAIDGLLKRSSDPGGILATVTGPDSGESRTGDLATILDEIAPRDVLNVSIGRRDEILRHYVSPCVVFSQNARHRFRSHSGVTIEISGEERLAAGGLFAALVQDVRRNVPWWAFLRRPSWSFIVFFLAPSWGLLFLSFTYVMQPYVASALPPGHTIGAVDALILAVSGLAPLVISAAFYGVARRWLLPAFEVREQGRASRPERWLVPIASVGLGLAGIVIPLLTN